MKVFLSHSIQLNEVNFYALVKDRLIEILKTNGIEVEILKMPEMYKSEIAINHLIKEYNIERRPVHLIVRPLEEVKTLESAYNIIYFAATFSNIIDFNLGNVHLNNELATLQSVQEIWVPNEFSKEVLINAGIELSKVYLCPVHASTQQDKKSINDINYINLQSYIDKPHKEKIEVGYPFKQSLLRKLTADSAKLTDYYGRFIKDGAVFPYRLFSLHYKIIKLINGIFRNLQKRAANYLKVSSIEKIDIKREEGNIKIELALENIGPKTICINKDHPLYVEIYISNGRYNYEKKTFSNENVLILPGFKDKVTLDFVFDPEMLPGEYEVTIKYSIDQITYHESANKVKFNLLKDPHFFEKFSKKYLCVIRPFDDLDNLEDTITSFAYFNSKHKDAALIIRVIRDGKSIEEVITQMNKVLLPYKLYTQKFNIFLIWEDFTQNFEYYFNLSKGTSIPFAMLDSMANGTVPVTVKNTGLNEYVSEENSFIIKSYKKIWESMNPKAVNFNIIYEPIWEDAVKALEESYLSKGNKSNTNKDLTIEKVSKAIIERLKASHD